MRKIKIPVLFFGIGCDPYKGATEDIFCRFRKFLDNLIMSNQFFISVRNDGSINNIRNYIGEKYLKYIHHVPDGGFFTYISKKDLFHPEIPDKGRIIAINVAGDMPDIRFTPKLDSSYLNYEEFIKEFANFLNDLLSEEMDISLIFVPHIYKDLEIISKVLNNLRDDYRRKRITVAPYLHGYEAHDYIFNIYRKSNLAMGMRFHTNVCSIALNTPTIALSTRYFKIRDLYQELELQDRIIDVSKRNFQLKLNKIIKDTFNKEEEIRKIYTCLNKKLRKDMELFCSKLNEWLREYF